MEVIKNPKASPDALSYYHSLHWTPRDKQFPTAQQCTRAPGREKDCWVGFARETQRSYNSRAKQCFFLGDYRKKYQ